jgi:hypothetical protein
VRGLSSSGEEALEDGTTVGDCSVKGDVGASAAAGGVVFVIPDRRPLTRRAGAEPSTGFV